MASPDRTPFVLYESDLPIPWCNIKADLRTPLDGDLSSFFY